MPNIVPYSNFHELNLDWILMKLKELEETVAGITGSADPSDDPPVMDGVASAGSSANYSRGDHVHPTDTSRASASDLSDLDTREYNDYIQLQGDINTVDAKIAFSSAAPLMDSSSASSGSSPYQARADHVHPTDTSRASALDVATLSARMDAFAGSANPSDSMPTMAGVGAAGSGANYSRGDHQHPSDTSKLDVAGGTITGALEVEGSFDNSKLAAYGQSDAIGWLRVATIPRVTGSVVEIIIAKRGVSTPAESHTIRLSIVNTPVFTDEISVADTQVINKIRYTNANKLDVHFDQNYASHYSITLRAYAPAKAEKNAIEILSTPEAVADSPAGETVLAEHTFTQSGYYEITPASTHTFGARTTRVLPFGNCMITELSIVLTLTEAVAAGGTLITLLPKVRFTTWGMPVFANNGATSTWSLILENDPNNPGYARIRTGSAMASGAHLRIHTMYITE